MKKITFSTNVRYQKSIGKERITIQLRRYNSDGVYDAASDEKATFTIHLKNCDIPRATQIISNALMNSDLISNNFEVE